MLIISDVTMSKKQQILYLLVFIIISSNSFFHFKLFMDYQSIIKFVYYFFVFLAIVLAFVFSKGKPNRIRNLIFRNQPLKLMLLLFVVILLSVFNAFIYKDQPLTIGLMTTLQTLSSFFLFFSAIGLGLNVQQFEKFIVWFGIIYVIILSFSFLTLPNPIFGQYSIDHSRGGVVRFRLPGYFWSVALYFYSIQQYMSKGKKLYLSLIVLCFFATVLTFARQYIAYTIVLGFIFYFLGISLKQKLNIIVWGLVFTLFVIPNTQIYKNYSNLTKEQMERNKYEEEDIRMKDYRVFLFDYPRSPMQYLFGCGLGSYGNSEYGDELENMTKTEHTSQADTGWAGFVFYHGYIGAGLLLLIILRSLFLKCPKRYTYLKYFIIYMSLCSVLGGTILYYHETLIILLSIYMLHRVSSLKKINELLTLVLYRCLQLSKERNLVRERKES